MLGTWLAEEAKLDVEVMLELGVFLVGPVVLETPLLVIVVLVAGEAGTCWAAALAVAAKSPMLFNLIAEERCASPELGAAAYTAR
jgi:hypothetical protein